MGEEGSSVLRWIHGLVLRAAVPKHRLIQGIEVRVEDSAGEAEPQAEEPVLRSHHDAVGHQQAA
jgi:hypothetical protein